MDWQQHDNQMNAKRTWIKIEEKITSIGQTVGGIVIICLIVTGCVKLCSLPSQPEVEKVYGTEELKAYAWTQCQMLIKQALKSPSSADFPWGINVQVTGDTYRVASYVDAKNSFGVEMRTNYYCQLTHTGGTNFTTDELTIIK